MDGHFAIALKITNVENFSDVAKPLNHFWELSIYVLLSRQHRLQYRVMGTHQIVQEVQLSNGRKKEGTM